VRIPVGRCVDHSRGRFPFEQRQGRIEHRQHRLDDGLAPEISLEFLEAQGGQTARGDHALEQDVDQLLK
jgi:hypothetical protein